MVSKYLVTTRRVAFIHIVITLLWYSSHEDNKKETMRQVLRKYGPSRFKGEDIHTTGIVITGYQDVHLH